jgi:hypothetical protein
MCPFVPRCNYAREQCERKNPPLMEVSPGHFSACWFHDEVNINDDQDRIAQKYGHPEPSDSTSDVDPDAPNLGVSPAHMSEA